MFGHLWLDRGFSFCLATDGYIWSERYLKPAFPPTPAKFQSDTEIQYQIRTLSFTFENGTELYRKYYYQGWWICRRNFFDGTDGFPYDPLDWEYLNTAVDLEPDDYRMHAQFAMGDGCRDCSNQIQELLKTNSAEELKSKLIDSPYRRFTLPIIFTAVFSAAVIWQWRSAKIATVKSTEEPINDRAKESQ